MGILEGRDGDCQKQVLVVQWLMVTATNGTGKSECRWQSHQQGWSRY